METGQEKILKGGEKFQMCVSNERSEIAGRIWERRFLCSQMRRSDDGFRSLKARADGCEELQDEIKKGKKANRDLCAQIACREWMDVRSFGQVFAFKGTEVSLGIRGPVSIHQAVSVSPVDIISMQIYEKC